MCAKSLFQVQSQKGQTGNKSLVSKDGGFTCEKEAFVEAASCFLADKAHLLLQEITPCIRSHSPAHSHVHLFFHFPSTPLLFIHIYFCNSLPLKHSLHCIFFLLALIFFFFFSPSSLLFSTLIFSLFPICPSTSCSIQTQCTLL